MVVPETESTFEGFDDDYQVIRLRIERSRLSQRQLQTLMQRRNRGLRQKSRSS